MGVFLTTQKKLAAAVGVSEWHLSSIKAGKGVSDALACRLEEATGIKNTTWASAGTKAERLKSSLKRFFKEEREREQIALKKAAARPLQGRV